MPSVIHRYAVATAALLVLVQTPASGQGSPEMRGEALASQHCAMCHAIGRSGSSPDARARPFRTLGQTQEIESLEEPLRSGALFGHPMMPGFALDARDAHALVRYLKSIQAR